MARPEALAVRRLLRRADFQALKTHGLRHTTQSFVIQYTNDATEPGLAVGFTTSGALGNAVHRNRARRRLKSAFDAVCRCNPAASLPEGAPGKRLVIVGKMPIFKIDFKYLLKDMQATLQKVGITC